MGAEAPGDATRLVRQIARGDREAFGRFYDRYAPLAFGVISRIVREPAEMPGPWGAAGGSDGNEARAAVVADFVAGMTDRYAIKEHRRLFDATPDLR